MNFDNSTKTLKILIPLILGALQFIHIVDFMLIMPLGDQLMKSFNISPSYFSTIVGSYGYAAAISSFFSAFIIDRFDRKSSLIFITLGFISGTFFCGIAEGASQLLIARIITGTFGGMINAIIFTIVGDLFSIERRSTVMGYIAAAFSIASAFGVPISLYFADLYTWNTPFLILACSSIPVLLLIIKVIPKINSHIGLDIKKKSPYDIINDLLKKKNQQYALLFIFILVFGQFITIPFFTPYLVRNVGLEQESIKYIYLFGGIATMITGPIIGKYSSKVGRQKAFVRIAILSLIPIYIITHLDKTNLLFVLIPSTFFFIFLSGRMIPAQALMTSVVHPNNRGSFMGLSSSMMQLGIGLSTLFAGLIVTEDGTNLSNFNYVGYISVILGVVVILLSRILTTDEKD
ncbi:MFS transporter [Candidatus Kapabacteria bacterium]|nr:MFS transporter [Candidatus Kapabacteria bacterium]